MAGPGKALTEFSQSREREIRKKKKAKKNKNDFGFYWLLTKFC